MRRSAQVVSLLFFALVLLGFQHDRVKFETGAYFDWENDLPQVSGMLFKPAGEGRSPAVVLLHTCGGLSPHVTQDWPAYLTGLGYVVLSVDSYSPRGYSTCTASGAALTIGEQAKDAFGALDYLASLPFVDGQRIAVMGFSEGAVAINDEVITRTRERTKTPNFRAAISYYGWCGWGYKHTENDIPLMQIAAELDPTTMRSCAVAMRGKPIEVHVLKGAYHAFDQPQITKLQNDNAGKPSLYDAAKTREARELTRAFLAKHL
jgi:dienelactone hydrolase